jgi:CubicO group peptidase (beta-lactamase class C family)
MPVLERPFPGARWEHRAPEELGFSSQKLCAVESFLHELAGTDEPFHLVVARGGYLVAEWNKGIDPARHQSQASAAKSYYSCLLGIAVSEGRLPSPDALVVDYYPEMMDVPPGEGPKEGRHAFAKDRRITFRQFICNCSGYMKPGEEPGKVFHYQTYGMNILTHALAKIYGLYDSRDPGRLPGCGRLIQDKLRDPIGASWTYAYANFDLHPKARLNIFGHYTQVLATAHDTARMGHLWLNRGNWNGIQVVPEDYLQEATRTNSFILENEPEENWCYGQGFWVNDHLRQWPDLPRDAFAASGAGAKHTWVCPSLDLVVSQNPGPWNKVAEEQGKKQRQNEILALIAQAIIS